MKTLLTFFWMCLFCINLSAQASLYGCLRSLFKVDKPPILDNPDRYEFDRDMRIYSERNRIFIGRKQFPIQKTSSQYVWARVSLDSVVLERTEGDPALTRFWENAPQLESVEFDQPLLPGGIVCIDELEKLFFHLKRTQKTEITLKLKKHEDGELYFANPFNFMLLKLSREDRALARRSQELKDFSVVWRLYRQTLESFKNQQWGIPFFQKTLGLYQGIEIFLSEGRYPPWEPDLPL